MSKSKPIEVLRATIKDYQQNNVYCDKLINSYSPTSNRVMQLKDQKQDNKQHIETLILAIKCLKLNGF